MSYRVEINKYVKGEEIIVGNQEVKGIKTVTGIEKYDKVIYNGDYPTLNDLIKDTKVPDKIYQPSTGCVMMYLLDPS